MKQTIEIEVPDGKKAIWKENKVVFEDIIPELPKSWEEFCNKYKVKEFEAYIGLNTAITTTVSRRERLSALDRSLLPSKEAAEAHLAYIQLHQLRDCYRQGWKPYYNNTSNKFCIVRYFNSYSCIDDYKIIIYTTLYSFLSFQSKEIAEEFLNNFRDLIEQASDLI